MIKEIIVYSPGDANDISTWSNVPYFFCRSLEKKGVKLDKVNVDVERKIYTLPIRAFIKLKTKIIKKIYGKDTVSGFYRSKYFDNKTLLKMKKGNRKFSNADLQVVFDFSHIIKNNKPIIMICDWTIEYYIEEHLKREPNKFEQRLIKKQSKIMQKADAVISIFPESYRQIKKYVPNKTYYFGHIVNSLEKYKENQHNQFKYRNILFIGSPKYINGLNVLIKAVAKYNNRVKKNEKLSLNIIGINKTQFDKDLHYEFCNIYGYLNKTIETQRKMYYKLLINSRIMVNPTANWNGASALFEGLYLGVPIIASHNLELDALMSNKIFSEFCSSESVFSLEKLLNRVFTETFQSFYKKSVAAHEFANNYTWDKFAEKFLYFVRGLDK